MTTGYKERVQYLLNRAVKISAETINFLADSWSKECKECKKKEDARRNTTDLALYSNAIVALILIFGAASAFLPMLTAAFEILFTKEMKQKYSDTLPDWARDLLETAPIVE